MEEEKRKFEEQEREQQLKRQKEIDKRNKQKNIESKLAKEVEIGKSILYVDKT